MICAATQFTGDDLTTERIINWNGDLDFAPERYFAPKHSDPNGPPDGLGSLVQAVVQATNARPRKGLTATGSAWSFEDNVRTDAWEISLANLTRQLDYVIGTREQTALTHSWRDLNFAPGATRQLVHVEAGIEIGALNDLLAAAGLALHTLGGSSGQSLAGALNTSTHGGDWNERPLPDYVRAIHLVTDGGRELWLERKTDRITEDAVLSAVLPCAHTQILRDDALFDAALVACGRMGVVYSYVLEVRQAFWVAEVVTRPARAEAMQALRDGIANNDLYGPLFKLARKIAPPANLALGQDNGVISTGTPTFWQLLFSSQNPEDCFLQRRWITSVRDKLPPDTNDLTGELDGAAYFLFAQAAFSALGAAVVLVPFVGPVYATALGLASTEMNILATGAPTTLGTAARIILNAMWRLPFLGNLVPVFANYILEQRYSAGMSTGLRGTHAFVTSGSYYDSHNDDYRSDSCELIFDATQTNYLTFLEVACAVGPSFKQCGYLSVRSCLASRATLSMHNFPSGRAVSIEIATMKGLPDNSDWMRFVQNLALSFGGRPHWGQMNKLDETQVTSIYGAQLIAWREALAAISGSSTVFSNNFTRTRGLEPMNILREVTAVHRTSRGVTTHLCGAAGVPWSPVKVADAVQQIESGMARYFTRFADQVAFLEVVDGKFLRTTPDSVEKNNLDALPECRVDG